MPVKGLFCKEERSRPISIIAVIIQCESFNLPNGGVLTLN